MCRQHQWLPRSQSYASPWSLQYLQELLAKRQAFCQWEGQHGIVDFILGCGHIVVHEAKFYCEGLIIQQDVRCLRTPIARLAHTARIDNLASHMMEPHLQRRELGRSDEAFLRPLPEHRQVRMADETPAHLRRVFIQIGKGFLEM